MGYFRHHTIVVTGSDCDWGPDEKTYGNELRDAHAAAKKIFKRTLCGVSPLSKRGANSNKSFFISPDGSKEGWQWSQEGDAARDKFIEFLETHRYDDGSYKVDWVEVQFGDDFGVAKTLRGSDHERYAAEHETREAWTTAVNTLTTSSNATGALYQTISHGVPRVQESRIRRALNRFKKRYIMAANRNGIVCLDGYGKGACR